MFGPCTNAHNVAREPCCSFATRRSAAMLLLRVGPCVGAVSSAVFPAFPRHSLRIVIDRHGSCEYVAAAKRREGDALARSACRS